jgi:hypothetical protein
MSSEFRKRLRDAQAKAAAAAAESPVEVSPPSSPEAAPAAGGEISTGKSAKDAAPKKQEVEKVEETVKAPTSDITVEQALEVVNSDISDSEYGSYMAELLQTHPEVHAAVVAAMSNPTSIATSTGDNDPAGEAAPTEGMPTVTAGAEPKPAPKKTKAKRG